MSVLIMTCPCCGTKFDLGSNIDVRSWDDADQTTHGYWIDVPRWIPVTERLPEKGIDVLVFAEGKIEGFFGDTVIAISGRYDFKIFTDFEEVEVWKSPWQYFLTDYEITHWMPLPEPPKEET